MVCSHADSCYQSPLPSRRPSYPANTIGGARAARTSNVNMSQRMRRTMSEHYGHAAAFRRDAACHACESHTGGAALSRARHRRSLLRCLDTTAATPSPSSVADKQNVDLISFPAQVRVTPESNRPGKRTARFERLMRLTNFQRHCCKN